MDIITQGLLGAAFAQSGAKPTETRLAAFVGFFSPLLADADALIQSSEDPLLYLEFHRHFSHALLFIPLGALLATLLIWPLIKKRLGFRKTYFYALLGYATAGLLDACTSYGTHLLWPFSEERVAWSIISIFDPIFSLMLIVAIIFCVIRCQPNAARIGVLFSVAYLFLGVIQQDRAESLIRQHVQQRGHVAERLIVKPTMGNLLLWRTIYQAEGHYYIDAVRVALPGNGKLFSGSSVQVFDMSRDLPQVADQMTLYRDIERFRRFSDGYIAWHPEQPNVLGDVRYAMLPTSMRPLWGIELNLDQPDEHVRFNTFRSMPDTERKAFFAMLFN